MKTFQICDSKYFQELCSEWLTSEEVDQNIWRSVENLKQNASLYLLDDYSNQHSIHGCEAVEEPEREEVLLQWRAVHLAVKSQGLVQTCQYSAGE